MITVANPVYDVVFKYLMEDDVCARGIIAGIIGKKIVHLVMTPQEITHEEKEYLVGIHRIDFHATIETDQGDQYDVIIEIQKSDNNLIIQRFRNYLGDRYKSTTGLPIITIYFLNFTLTNPDLPAVISVNRHYTNAITHQPITTKDPFIEMLTHDSIVIQIPKLQPSLQTDLEKVLWIWGQKKFVDDEKKITIDSEPSDPLIGGIVNRLTRAIADYEMRRKMEIEDEIHGTLGVEVAKVRQLQQELGVKDEVIQMKDEAIQEQQQVLQEQQQVLQEKDQVLQEQQQALQAKDEEIRQMKKMLGLG